MKFLLVAINAKYIHSNLAVYSLKSYAEKYGNNVGEIEIAEYTINQQPEEILRDIYEKRADVVGFSCYIWNIDMVKEIARDLKTICPEVDICVGGPEVSYNLKEILTENSYIDFIMYSEGEKVFKEIASNYDKERVKNVNGVAFLEGDKLITNPPQEILDLSEIPFVYNDMKDFENKIIYYESSRGCPFSCSYCLSSVDKRLRFRDIELVKVELKFFIDQKVAQVKFVDRTFNCKKDHAVAIWQFIKDNDNGITNFHFEVAADLLNDEQIELIKNMRPGLIQLEIGVQSTNPKTLEAINRKTSVKDIAEKTARIREAGNIHQHLDLIAGLPYEDYDSFKNSFNEVYTMKPDQLQLGFLKILHGAQMSADAREYGVLYSSKAPYEVLKTNWLNYDDILKLKMVETVVEIYYNSFQFENAMKELEKYFDTPFDLYESLSQYYKENTLNGAKHSRANQYVLLKNFAEKVTIEIDWAEVLAVDYYLRENAKSRPSFAKNQDQYKSQIRDFYKSEKAREILPDYEVYDSKQVESMTHVEVLGINKDAPTYILFDYKNRNPLNHQAKIIDITEWIN